MRGDIKFTNNSVEDGGALKLISFAQMKLHENTTITFSENKGRLDLAYIIIQCFQIIAFTAILSTGLEHL